MQDARGIDVAFIFDADLFAAPPIEVFFHVVMKRHATREIVQVNFQTHRNSTWSIFGNHWPSRSGGQFESEGYRDMRARRSATSINVHSKSTASTRRPWRWATSTTNPSTGLW